MPTAAKSPNAQMHLLRDIAPADHVIDLPIDQFCDLATAPLGGIDLVRQTAES